MVPRVMSHGRPPGFAAGCSALCFIVVAAGCDVSGDRAREARQSALANGEGTVDTLVLEPAQIVGHMSEDPNYLFGSISAVATDAYGVTYVADRSDASVQAYASDGTFLGRVAREGGGPGEVYQAPANLLLSADGHLYLRDGARVTVFGRGARGSFADSVVFLWRTPGGGNLTSHRSGFAKDGRYFYPGGLYLDDQLSRFFYVSYSDGQLDGDTLEVPAYLGLAGVRPAVLRLGVDAIILRGLNRVPFSPVPVWDVTPDGTLLSSDGASPVLLETGVAGDTIRVIRLPGTAQRRVPPREREDSLAALDERIASVPGDLSQVVGLGEGVEERRIPAFLPTVIGLSVSNDGSIWVERWPPERDPDARYYDVLDRDGTLRHTIVLRLGLLRDPSPWFDVHFVSGIVRDTATGVEQVARFDLPPD